LEPYNLGPEQLVVASIFLVLYLPCCATFFTLTRELGWRDALRILMILLGSGFLVGGALNLIFKII
jgi:ferrous iron transport protein B